MTDIDELRLALQRAVVELALVAGDERKFVRDDVIAEAKAILHKTWRSEQ